MKIHKKTVATRAASFGPCTKSFVGWGFAPDPTMGELTALPRPAAGLVGGATREGE